METYVINPRAFGEMTEEQFFQFCRDNKDLKIERNNKGQLILMPPTGSETGIPNANINADLVIWNRTTGLGFCFDSSTGFTLPNKAVRSPDASWIAKDHWLALPLADRQRFAHICPDFVVELMSRNDTLEDSQEKMEEWMGNGCRLGWLIHPYAQQAYVYRQRGNRLIINSFTETLSGEEVLPGFELRLNTLL